MKQNPIISMPFIIINTVLSLALWVQCSSSSFQNQDQELKYMLSDLVENDRSIRNCAFMMKKGDGSFSWSGAAGIAQQKGQALMRVDTPVYIASVTKLYTATAIMILYEKGMLSLDDPMAKYLPGKIIQGIHVYKGKDYSRDITIRQLLSHTSGIADYYAEKPEGGESLSNMLLKYPKRSWTVDDTIERARSELTPHFAPGRDVSYSDTNYQLLGKILEAVTGNPLHAVYDAFFIRPLKLKSTWLVGLSKPLIVPSSAPADVFHDDTVITRTRSNRAYWADGGIVSTAEDCVNFLKALNEGRLIKRNTLKMMHQWRSLRFPLQYGLGTMRFALPGFMNIVMKVPPLWGHSGSTGSFLYYSEDLDIYFAGSINQTASMVKPFMLISKAIKIYQKWQRK